MRSVAGLKPVERGDQFNNVARLSRTGWMVQFARSIANANAEVVILERNATQSFACAGAKEGLYLVATAADDDRIGGIVA